MKYELVIIWSNGDRDVYEYENSDRADEAGAGMKMALGNQISWWCTRPKLNY